VRVEMVSCFSFIATSSFTPTHINNIYVQKEENRRILSKEGGMMGLSEGQRRQVTRNEERLATLQEEVLNTYVCRCWVNG
jgi:hypothetical protein